MTALLYAAIVHLIIIPMWSAADPRFATVGMITSNRAIILSVAALASLSMVIRRSHPLVAASLTTADLWLHGICLLYPVALYTLVVQARYRWALFFVPIGSAIPFVNPIHAPYHGFIPHLPPMALLVYNYTSFVTPMVTIPFFVGVGIRTHRMIIGSERDLSERLRRERTLQARNICLEERARLAQDLHDVVAQYVGLMVIHAGALEIRSADDPTTRETAILIGGLGRRAMAELRDLLRLLYSEPDDGVQPWKSDPESERSWLKHVKELVQQTQTTGTAVQWHVTGELLPEHRPAFELAYRCVQEGLTNTARHAPGSDIDIRVDADRHCLQVAVRNAAPPVAAHNTGGENSGIAGLRERAAPLAATVTAQPTPDGGFALLLHVPIASPSHGAPSHRAKRQWSARSRPQAHIQDDEAERRGHQSNRAPSARQAPAWWQPLRPFHSSKAPGAERPLPPAAKPKPPLSEAERAPGATATGVQVETRTARTQPVT
ncbi:histidine kinase [Streptomyces sp. NPDC005728]|uniref:sensor histidine kinase n=1 Tax=Streptomyces sp. NPDC005728 TaxID=3157054 RepID=UPI0033D76F64